MDNNNACTLRSIILDYAKIKNIEFENEEKEDYYITDRRKEIFSLCKFINLDLQQFRKRVNEYEIPHDVATIISVYLRQPSGKGTVMSNMKYGKYDKITDEEKKGLFKELIDELKSKAEDDTSLLLTIDFLEKQFSDILKQNVRRKDAINQIKESINNVITRAVNAVTGLDDRAGLMLYYNGYSNNDYPEETDYEASQKKVKEAKKDKNDKVLDMVEYQSNFNYDDQMELVKCLNKFVVNAVDEWTKIVDIAKEIRKEDILEACMQDIDDSMSYNDEMSMEDVQNDMNQIIDSLFSSEELVQLAVCEYEENIRVSGYNDSNQK